MDSGTTVKATRRYLLAAAITAIVLAIAANISGERPLVYGLPRSPEWREVRAAYLAIHPHCEACGADNSLGPIEVHHIKSFHTNPELELEQSNLISLCRYGSNCHFYVGHDPDHTGPIKPSWLRSNPNVREDARKHLEKLKGM